LSVDLHGPVPIRIGAMCVTTAYAYEAVTP